MSASPSLSLGAPSARILIVDDEPDNCELLQIVLNWEGFTTQIAATGQQALACAAEQLPDLVVLDLMMPDLDGYQVTLALKQNPRTRHIPIMILSAMTDHVTRQRVLNAGAEAFISKPIDRAELNQLVRGILGLDPGCDAS